MDEDTNSAKGNVLNTPSNAPKDVLERRWSIINYVKVNPNSSAYQIAKGLKLNYSTVHEALRQIVFARLLYVKQALDSQDRPIEVFFLGEKQGGEEMKEGTK